MKGKTSSKSKENSSDSQRKKVVIKLGERLCRQRIISEMCQKQKQNKQSKRLYKRQEMESSTDKQLLLETIE